MKSTICRAALSAALIMFACSLGMYAQNSYAPGQRIEYRDGSRWYPGTIVKVMPEYNQVLVRWDPRDDYPSYTHNGISSYEQGYGVSDVRPLTAQNNTQKQPGTTASQSRGGMGSVFGRGQSQKTQPPQEDTGGTVEPAPAR